jgi:hypothetical protein
VDPDFAMLSSLRRWLLLSGGLEIGVGFGHSVVGSLIVVRPTLALPVVATLGWPKSLLTPIVPPEQNAVVLALSLLAGTAWMLFGAILVWLARAAHPNVSLIAILLVHQLSFCLLMFLLAPFLFPIPWIVGLAAAALGVAFAKALRSSRCASA